MPSGNSWTEWWKYIVSTGTAFSACGSRPGDDQARRVSPDCATSPMQPSVVMTSSVSRGVHLTSIRERLPGERHCQAMLPSRSSATSASKAESREIARTALPTGRTMKPGSRRPGSQT